MRGFHFGSTVITAIAAVLITAGFAANAGAQTCDVDREIKFSGYDWASNSFHVEVARLILEKGYGCRTTSVPGTTQPLLNALARGDVDVRPSASVMEIPPSDFVVAGQMPSPAIYPEYRLVTSSILGIGRWYRFPIPGRRVGLICCRTADQGAGLAAFFAWALSNSGRI